jgi:hypothetical protein
MRPVTTTPWEKYRAHRQGARTRFELPAAVTLAEFDGAAAKSQARWSSSHPEQLGDFRVAIIAS